MSATYETFLDTPSMGKYYNANIKGTGSDGPYDCRTHRAPKYLLMSDEALTANRLAGL